MSNQELIQIVKERMSKNGITVYRIAKKTNISQSTIHRWLKGEFNITIPILCLILEALELDMEVKEITISEILNKMASAS